MGNRSYADVIAEIEGKRRFGAAPGVEVSRRMLAALGNPQSGIKLIHIAGTNGKGSVSAFLCAILEEAGLRVGMFTSPHLCDFRERIRVNGVMIAETDAGRIGEELSGLSCGAEPAMFDYCVAMAAVYFKEQRCDVIVAETGLGGRLDSTSALGIPDVTVITKIGYDHMEILGNTLAEIASEKAGILKRGTRLVTESQTAQARDVLLAAARSAGVPWREGCLQEISNEMFTGEGQIFSFRNYENLRMRMLGLHQYENAAAAILAAEDFLSLWAGQPGRCAPHTLSGCIRRGIARAVWPGRMEVLCRKPFFMVDGAHNSSGVRALRDSLMSLFPGEKFHFIMGVLADKDYEGMVEAILPLAKDFKTVTVDSSRALQAGCLAGYIRGKGIPAESLGELPESLFPLSGKTVAFGSLYFVGELIRRYSAASSAVQPSRL